MLPRLSVELDSRTMFAALVAPQPTP